MGDYVFFIKARDSSGFVTEAQPLTLSLSSGETLQAARFDTDTNVLWLPAVSVCDLFYSAELSLLNTNTLLLELLTVTPAQSAASAFHAHFDPLTGILRVPALEGFGQRYGAVLQWEAEHEWFRVLKLE